MNHAPITNLFSALDTAVPDPVVGISLAHLAGDDEHSVYGTKIPPGGKLKAHHHQHGNEFYQVISGQGQMLLKSPEGESGELNISTGDIFVIPPMTIHQLMNPGPDPLVMLFSCPQSHIGSDRYLCESLTSD